MGAHRDQRAAARRYRDRVAADATPLAGTINANRELFRSVFAQVDEAVLIIDALDGTILEFNEQAHVNLGYTRSEFEQLTIDRFDARESKKDVHEHLRNIFEHGSDTFETRHRTKTGELRDVIVRARLLRTPGRPMICSVFQDVTSERAMVRDLSAAEARWRAMTNASPDVVLLLARTGEPLFTNRCAEVTEAIASAVRPTLAAVSGPTTDFPTVNAQLMLQGVEHVFEARAAPIPERDHTTEFVVVAREITDRRNTEIELARHRARLQHIVQTKTAELEASRAKILHDERLVSIGTLAAGIAHEINNPIGTILLAAELAQQERANRNSDAGLVDEGLEDIVREAERCGRIVKSVLQFARREPTERAQTDVAGVVRHAADMVRGEGRSAGVSISVSADDGEHFVDANSTELEHAIVNLLRNALQASRPGHRVEVTVSRVEDEVGVRVRDTGCGIAANDLPRIFDPFYTTKRDRGGTGLGLSMAHGIVEAHRGSIDIVSLPGEGTAITIRLPAAG